MSAPSNAPTQRARPPPRKKPHDDAAYMGPPTVNGVKRPAPDRADSGDLSRVKRKRTEPSNTTNHRDSVIAGEVEHRISLVEFDKFPLPTLYRYLSSYDIVPVIHPSPLKADDPPSPASLNNPPPTVARRSPSPSTLNKRRSSRLVDDDDYPTRMPIIADVEDMQIVLADIADRHFREVLSVSAKEEVDTLANFMQAVEKYKTAKFR